MDTKQRERKILELTAELETLKQKEREEWLKAEKASRVITKADLKKIRDALIGGVWIKVADDKERLIVKTGFMADCDITAMEELGYKLVAVGFVCKDKETYLTYFRKVSK